MCGVSGKGNLCDFGTWCEFFSVMFCFYFKFMQRSAIQVSKARISMLSANGLLMKDPPLNASLIFLVAVMVLGFSY